MLEGADLPLPATTKVWRVWRVEGELDLLAGKLGLNFRLENCESFLQFSFSSPEIRPLVGQYLERFPTPSHKALQCHQVRVSINGAKEIDVDCAGCHALKDDAPSLFTPAADLNLIGAKAVHPSGVKCRLVQTKSRWGQIGHSGNLGGSTPFTTVDTLSLMTSDSCSATDDPILLANFSEYLLRARVEEPFIDVSDDQLGDPVLGVKHDWMHSILIQQRGVSQVTPNSDQLSGIIKLRSKSD